MILSSKISPDKGDLLLKNNPVHTKAPVLLHNGRPITESLVFLAYIDETWKQNPLLPLDPYEREVAGSGPNSATISFYRRYGKTFISEVGEQEATLVEATEVELKGKCFFSGQNIEFLDISMNWLAYLIRILEEISGLKLVDHERLLHLSTWMKEFYNAPVMKELWPPHA